MLSLQQIAAHIQIEPPKRERMISGLNGLPDATEGELTFITENKYIKLLSACSASVILMRPEWVSACPSHSIPWLVDHPALVMAKISALFVVSVDLAHAQQPLLGSNARIHPTAVLGKNTLIGADVVIAAGVVLGDGVSIGDRSVIHPNVCIYDDCHVGADCIIHAGTVVGVDGFGYVADEHGKRIKWHQLGNVVLEEGVEIGANTCIDRAAFATTLIKAGVKIDNLVHIAHNVSIGEDSVLCAQVGLAGSVRLGRQVICGPQSGVAGHLSVADGVVLAARAGVTKPCSKPGIYSGFPAMPHTKALKEQARLRQIIKRPTPSCSDVEVPSSA